MRGNKEFVLWGRSMGAATSTLVDILSYPLPEPNKVPVRHLRVRFGLALRLPLVPDQTPGPGKIYPPWFHPRAHPRLPKGKDQAGLLFRYQAT